jgi:hypothetical protein
MPLTSVSEDIRVLLDANGFGVSATDLFSHQWGSGLNGAEIDKQILVRDNGDIDALDKTIYETPTFTILVRGGAKESFSTVRLRARTIYETMLQEERQVINGNEYVQFAPQGGLLPIGKDASNRWVFTMNFFTFREAIGA